MEISDYKAGLVAFIVILALLALLNPSPPLLETGGTKKTSQENYSIDGQEVFVKRNYFTNGESIAYENKGTQGVEFGILDAIPPSLADNSQQVVFSNAGTGEGKTTLFDNNEPPVLRHTTITLGPGESFERRMESRKFTLFPVFQKPLHLFSPAQLSEEEKKVLEPMLRKASALAEQFNDNEREILEAKINEAMLKAREERKSIAETAQAVEEFLDEVKKEKDASSASPSPGASASPKEEEFVDKLKQMQVNFNKGIPTPTPQQLELPKMPGEIVLTVREDAPEAGQEFFAEAKLDVGEALVRIDGEAGNYASVLATKSQNGYAFEVNAFVDADFENGVWPFDSIEGVLEVSFSKTFFETARVPIKIKIEHVKAPEVSLDEFGTDYNDSNYVEPKEADLTPATQKSPTTCQQDAQAVIEAARKYLGKYIENMGRKKCPAAAGTTRTCACFVSNAFRDAGYGSTFGFDEMVYHLYQKAKKNGAREIARISDMIPGDLVLMKTYPGCCNYPYTHIGIYLGNDQMIHSGHPVKITKVSTYAYNGRKAFRIGLRVLQSCLK